MSNTPADRQLTLLVALAHPDDEVGAAAAILAQKARGDRVVLMWLTRGEMTEALGPIPATDIIRRRMEHGRRAGEILGVETRFMDFADTRLEPTRAAAYRVAKVIADIQPDGVLTWGDAWQRGMRHPDHQACGQVVRDAITLSRLKRVIDPTAPHREPCPVFTYRDVHSTIPPIAIDAEPWMDTIHELGRAYCEDMQFPHPEWLDEFHRRHAEPFGLKYAEVFDAWESEGGLVDTLLPTTGYNYTPRRNPPHVRRPPGARRALRFAPRVESAEIRATRRER